MLRSILPVLLTASLFSAPCATRAAENPYDVFARLVAPYVAMLASDSRAEGFSADLQLVSASHVDARFQGVTLSVALQMPDRLRIRARTRDDEASLVRDGQTFFATPAAPAREILKELAPGVLAYTGSIQTRISDFKLPFPPQQLVFLPALFQIDDQGSQEVDDENCRVLDVALTPAIAQGEAGNWRARLWITADYRLVRIEAIGSKDAQVTVAVKNMRLTDEFPAATFARPEGGEVLELSPAQIEQIFAALRNQMRL